MTKLLHFAHLTPKDVVPEKRIIRSAKTVRQNFINPTIILFRSQRQPYIVPIVDLISLAPLLVQQLLELLVGDDLLVTIEDGHVEVGVVVAAIRPANTACG